MSMPRPPTAHRHPHSNARQFDLCCAPPTPRRRRRNGGRCPPRRALLNLPAFAGHTTGQADFPHPALGQDFTLSRATPSAASEHLLELLGFPISRSFTAYCVCLELRSLPSTGVTRLPRYYEPLRHPRAPSLSLTGFRLVIANHALGLPVFRALSLCTCRRHYR